MRFRLLALLPSLLLGALVLPVVAQTSSRQRITDLSGEVIAPGPVKVDRQWALPGVPYPVRVNERIINRMRITELSAGPAVAPPGAGPRFRKPDPWLFPKAVPPVGSAPRVQSEVPAKPAPVAAPLTVTAPADKAAAPEEGCLKITKYTCGQVRHDDKGRTWVQVYGERTCDSPGEIPGWVMPHPSGVPFFYTQDGRLFRLQAKAEARK